MNIVRMSLVSALGLCALSAGCEVTEVNSAVMALDGEVNSTAMALDGEEEDPPEPEDIEDESDTNGLAASTFQMCKHNILWAMSYPLTDPDPANTGELNPAIVNALQLNTTTACEPVLDYMVRCGAPPSCALTYGYQTYAGGGLLKDNGWCTGDLSSSERDTVLACIAAHVNGIEQVPGTAMEVDIVLRGLDIADTDPADPPVPSGGCDEALWVAKGSFNLSTGQISLAIHAWPLNCVVNSCDQNQYLIKEALRRRICGNSTSCDFTTHGDVEDDPNCVNLNHPGDPAGYNCFGSNVIQTRVGAEFIPDLYPRCSVD